ncbi:hypothetical protein D3C87_196060 [compost metagenome]
MRSICLYIAALFFLYSCRKDDHSCNGKHTPGQNVLLSPSLAPYQFKKDSYWTYQNDATAQLDSQRVEFAYMHDWFTGGGSSTCSGATTFHEYRMGVRSFLTNQFVHYYMIGGNLFKDPQATGNMVGKNIFNNMNSFPPESGLEQEIIPTLTLNGNTFHNVKKIRVKHLEPTSSNPYPTNLSEHDLHFYFKDSVGIVKWEVVDGSTVLESWGVKSWQVFL